jgi:hypothetical protein
LYAGVDGLVSTAILDGGTMKIIVSEEESVEVKGVGRNGDGEYFIFLEGELIPRWIGKLTHEFGLVCWFEGLEYAMVREYGEASPNRDAGEP